VRPTRPDCSALTDRAPTVIRAVVLDSDEDLARTSPASTVSTLKAGLFRRRMRPPGRTMCAGRRTQRTDWP
jgi:hypothetical protein